MFRRSAFEFTTIRNTMANIFRTVFPYSRKKKKKKRRKYVSFPAAIICQIWYLSETYPDSKVHGANMGSTWGRQDPGGPHVGPMNLVIWVILTKRGRNPVLPWHPLSFSIDLIFCIRQCKVIAELGGIFQNDCTSYGQMSVKFKMRQWWIAADELASLAAEVISY